MGTLLRNKARLRLKPPHLHSAHLAGPCSLSCSLCWSLEDEERREEKAMTSGGVRGSLTGVAQVGVHGASWQAGA